MLSATNKSVYFQLYLTKKRKNSTESVEKFCQSLLGLLKTNDIFLIFIGGHLKICQSWQLCQRPPEKIPKETAVTERDGELVKKGPKNSIHMCFIWEQELNIVCQKVSF